MARTQCTEGTLRHGKHAPGVSRAAPRPASGGKAIASLADRDLIARLVAGDSDAWDAIQHDIVTPLFRANIKGIAQQCARVGLSDNAVFSRLYVNLSRDGFAPLRAFRFDCAFSSWLYWHVWNAAQGAIREVTGKIGQKLSAPNGLDALTRQEETHSGAETAEELDEANRLLAQLWESNPVYALVLVLRNDVGLSAKETGSFLGKTVANVNQINHRAQSRMRKLRAQLHEGA